MRSVCSVGILLLIFHSDIGQCQDVEDVLTKLQRKYESMRDLYASFTQVVRFGVTQSTQTFNGKLWMKRKNKYRIELDQQTIVTDGKSVWTYSEINRQVLIDTFKDDPKAATPDRMLANAPRDYISTIIGQEEVDGVETLVLKLLPRERKSLTQFMKVWVDPAEWLMMKVEILDVSDNRTTYTAKDIKVNDGVSDQFFRFVIPPDVEVLDLRSSP